MECHSEDGARLAELDNMTRCGTKNCVALLGLHVHIVGRLHPVLFYERSFPVAVSTSAPLSLAAAEPSPLQFEDDFWECLASIMLNNCSVLSHRIPT